VKHKVLDKSDRNEVARLFLSVFTSSEGAQEGRRLGNLAAELSSRADNQEIICLGAFEEDALIGSIFFTRLLVNGRVLGYMLAPVAVDARHQGRGVGRALIEYGLEELKARGVAVVVTYGDPGFYSKVGFETLSENVIQAPLRLSMPEGWLGLSLTDEPIPTVDGRPACVREFHDPVYW